MWILFAFGSALFAGLTSILAKCGIKNTDSNAATAIRTIIVLIFSWIMVFLVGAQHGIGSVSAKTWTFLILSGLATGASWLCYFHALQIGDVCQVPVQSKEFGRIATMNAKNLILQKIREEERKAVFDQYFEKEKDIVTGIVQRYIGKNISVNLGKADAILTENEQVKGEHFEPTERIKLYIVEVKNTPKGPKILVSRTHPELVKRLFESEVTEVKDGTVEIKSIAREAGSRTKIAVWSNDPDVDPVGACVGMNGARVNAIVNELRGEKIDIINWSDNPAILIENALSPAKVISVMADPDEKTASVIVPDYQLSLAIGKEGQNARLAARLTGYKIDIKNETQAIESGELPENYMELSEGVYEEEYDDDAEEFDVENTADAEYDEDDAEITFDEVEDTEE